MQTEVKNEVVKMSQQAPVQFDFFNADHFATMQRVCTMFANSELVPERYRISEKNPKEKAIANCMIAVETATRIGASPLLVMQNLYVVYGTPGWSAKFLIGTVNSCGRFETMQYRMTNKGTIKVNNQEIENWECVAFNTAKGSKEILESIPVTIQMAVDEGWYLKNGSKWKTMPKLMLQYRAGTFWTRVYAPELSMGMKTAEEIQDIETIEYEDVSKTVDREINTKANKTEMKFDDTERQDAKPDAQPAGNQEAGASPAVDSGKPASEIKMEGPGF